MPSYKENIECHLTSVLMPPEIGLTRPKFAYTCDKTEVVVHINLHANCDGVGQTIRCVAVHKCDCMPRVQQSEGVSAIKDVKTSGLSWPLSCSKRASVSVMFCSLSWYSLADCAGSALRLGVRGVEAGYVVTCILLARA